MMLKRIPSNKLSQSLHNQEASMKNLNRSTSSPSRRRIRRAASMDPAATLKLDFDANKLEHLIQWLCNESSDKQLSQSYRQRYQGLAERHANKKQTVWTQEELHDIITAIQTLLSTVQEPSSDLVAEAHTKIGVIHQRLSHDARATQSFMQALWVQSSRANVSPVALGLTKTRLALAYGRKGDYEKAISLLEKARQDYQEGGLKEDHELFVKSNEALQGFYFAQNHRSSKISKLQQDSRRISQGAA